MINLRRIFLLLFVTVLFCSFISPATASESVPPNPIVEDSSNGNEQILGTGCGWNQGHWGCWGDWMTCSSTCTRYFAPGRSGYHAVQFVSDWNVYHWGRVTPYWRDGNGSWHSWSYSDVMNYYRTMQLYSGSSTINYKFVFTPNGNGGKVYFRFFTD